ncbi:Sec-independent protein translocase protein TatA [Candidatus Hydrogenisulfobacillus filiaventi]|uniref:Sec-independent protein translocase protein TatA n=1 Tax=Candidatus Hydrogenisulfobacillus filiaventi TaxID=2707344 RepID=A0A6F8ZEZ5_9FIRM|nr:Sec-independent protein translocase protein TatA [Candidatus Hydrogenisulfobacillus filiaventi]
MWMRLLDPAHLVLLLVVVVLIFGPKRLPELGASVGKTIRMFRAHSEGKGLSEPSEPDVSGQSDPR